MNKKGAYKGPVCFVGHDHEDADGRLLEGGWHYSVVDDGNGGEMPGEKLVITSAADSEPTYRYATASDESHQAKHHQRLKLVAVGGYMGEPKTPEDIEACHRHLDDLSERIGDLDPHEKDHLITSATDILLARKDLPPREDA